MRTLPVILGFTALALARSAVPVFAAEVATATVTVNVQIASRTSLKVSSQMLRFDVGQPGAPATAAIDFSAGARVSPGADVVLTVEPLQHVDGPGGAADTEPLITFDGDGDGLLDGKLDAEGSIVAGRWQGSGLRRGRLFFRIHANAAGAYTVPVRFVLSTP